MVELDPAKSLITLYLNRIDSLIKWAILPDWISKKWGLIVQCLWGHIPLKRKRIEKDSQIMINCENTGVAILSDKSQEQLQGIKGNITW